jgi:hypothetical protein
MLLQMRSFAMPVVGDAYMSPQMKEDIGPGR